MGGFGTYTPPGGLTPQAQQLNQGQPSVTNSQAPAGGGDPLANQYGAAAQQLGNMQTSDARQGYVNNSNLPAMQSNYDDLAKKLFEYDQGSLSPQFQGVNTGVPTDAAAFGRVEASPLAMTEGSANLPASQGIYNPNPKYAYTAQILQANSLADVMDTLNKSIGQEFNMRSGTYKNTVDKQIALLNSISESMNKRDTVAMKNAELQAQKESDQNKIDASFREKMLELGYIDPLTGQVIDPSKRDNVNPGDVYSDSSRKSQQDYFNSLPPNSPFRSKVANSYKAAHGQPLFPGALTDKQVDNLNTTADMLRMLDRIKSEISSLNSKGVHNVQNPLSQWLLEHGGPFGSLVTGPEGDLGRDLMLIQGKADRQLMGGRLIRDLVLRFSGAFPSLNLNQKDILSRINTMRNDVASDLKNYASTQGYSDPQQFLKDHMVDDVQIKGGSNAETTRTINGTTYKKVTGGWQKI